MARSERARRVTHTYKLDGKPYADKVRKAGKAADRVLQRYGESVMSRAELRNKVDKELGSTSLTELIVKEREAGW
ncbi:MAG: hypothetical protein HYV04_06705 [Deltaproteobacteria bacterium]|nr:hypothetical protein [Deltaproteobacteria bacterium]